MKKMQKSFAILIALSAIVGFVATDTVAGVRVHVVVRTPTVRVNLGNTSSAPYLYAVRKQFPVRARARYKITRADLLIARRLARFTGVETRELTRLREWGYTWAEIGRWLRLSPPVVRAAMNERSWDRFLRDRRCLASDDGHRDRHGRQVAYFDHNHNDH